MYASSLKQSLILKEDPLNGTKIIERLKNKIYKSAMGYMVRMDENGDAEGNYSLVALDTINGVPGTLCVIFTIFWSHFRGTMHSVCLKG